MDESILQRQIDDALNARSRTDMRITLDYGSEVTDLTANADVRLFEPNKTERTFTFVPATYVGRMFREKEHDPKFDDCNYVFVTPDPLIIAKEITGETIVRGVLRYLRMHDLG